MIFPNKNQFNLIIDIVLDLLLECYILWNVKKLLVIKVCITIKKILYVFRVDLLDYLFSENCLLIDFAKQKTFELIEDNKMIKLFLTKKKDIEASRNNLASGFYKEYRKRKEYHLEFKKISDKNEKEAENKYEEKKILNN